MSGFTLRMYALRDALRLLRTRWATFLLSVLLCACALALLLLTATVAQRLAPLADQMPLGPEVSVFVAMSAGPQEVNTLKTRLEQTPGIERVKWITRAEALAELGRRSGGGAAVSELKINPLPDALVVTFRPGTEPAAVEAAASSFRQLPSVDGVHADSGWYRKGFGLFKMLRRAASFISGVTLLLLVLIVIGAVKLLAVATRDELRLLRLVGAEDRQITRPYSYVGAIVLVVSAGLAVASVGGLLAILRPDMDWLARVLGVPISVGLPPWPVLAGAASVAGLVGGIAGALGLRIALLELD